MYSLDKDKKECLKLWEQFALNIIMHKQYLANL